MNPALILCLAMLLDAAMGEPRWLWQRLPHPAVLMGRAVNALDERLNTGGARRIRGILAMALLAILAVTVGYVLQSFGFIVEIVVAAILLAHRSLIEHVRAVAGALRLSVPEGRRAVSHIVGRDTSAMEQEDVARAAIESAAENFSDGVIAPAFWFLIAGLPGLLLYKITNTADSMIGYRNTRYAAFGWAAARLDDVLNVIPARLTAALLAVTHRLGGARHEIGRDARLHRSPNAGWPEAAMARALGVALSGPRSYGGDCKDYPFVNEAGDKAIGAAQIEAACVALWRGWTAALALVAAIAVVLG